MKATIYRITGFGLSLTVTVLGIASTVLLYYSGQNAIDVFYSDISVDEYGVYRKPMPTDHWYGELMLRGWGFGFIYMLPGITGIVAVLFYNKWVIMVHFILSILLLFIGSFLHTGGAMGLILYRYVFVAKGAPWLGTCSYIRDDAAIEHMYVDSRCVAGREALTLAIAAASVMLAAWIFIFSDIFFRAFTYHHIRSEQKQEHNRKQGYESFGIVNTPDERRRDERHSNLERQGRGARNRRSRPRDKGSVSEDRGISSENVTTGSNIEKGQNDPHVRQEFAIIEPNGEMLETADENLTITAAGASQSFQEPGESEKQQTFGIKL